MSLFTLQNLGSDIVGCTTNGSFALSVEFKLGGETKVSNLDLHLLVQEKVTKFEISMNDSVRMEVLDSIANLHDIALNFELVEALSPSEKLVHGSGTAHFEQDVDVLGVLEEVLEADDVRVMQTTVDLDL